MGMLMAIEILLGIKERMVEVVRRWRWAFSSSKDYTTHTRVVFPEPEVSALFHREYGVISLPDVALSEIAKTVEGWSYTGCKIKGNNPRDTLITFTYVKHCKEYNLVRVSLQFKYRELYDESFCYGTVVCEYSLPSNITRWNPFAKLHWLKHIVEEESPIVTELVDSEDKTLFNLGRVLEAHATLCITKVNLAVGLKLLTVLDDSIRFDTTKIPEFFLEFCKTYYFNQTLRGKDAVKEYPARYIFPNSDTLAVTIDQKENTEHYVIIAKREPGNSNGVWIHPYLTSRMNNELALRFKNLGIVCTE